MSVEEIVLLSDETPIVELDELRPLIAGGQERGFLTFAEIEACLEEVEVTKEQVQELHAYLDEQGIEVVESDGRLRSGTGPQVVRPAHNARMARVLASRSCLPGQVSDAAWPSSVGMPIDYAKRHG